MKAMNFFREEPRAIIGVCVDGDKIFIGRFAERIETIEIEMDTSDAEGLAKQIALLCKRKGWKTSAVGFCLNEADAVTFQTEIANVPAKEIPALVKSWARAQAGVEAVSAFARVGEELWMETVPRDKFEALCAAFERFGLKLRAVSVMPSSTQELTPLERATFISTIIRERKSPNLLATGSGVNWRRLSLTLAATFLVVLIVFTAKIFSDKLTASEDLLAAQTTLESRSEDFALKQAIEDDITSLRRFNRFAAQIPPSNFNFLLRIGKTVADGISLTSLNVEENVLELDGIADSPSDLRDYLARVKASVVQSAQIEITDAAGDEITFTIRAALENH